MENIARTVAIAVLARQQLRDLLPFLKEDGLAMSTYRTLEQSLIDLELEIRQIKIAHNE